MARKIKSAFRRALKGLLTVLGLSSIITACVDSDAPAYGLPPNYDVKYISIEGTVTDDDGQAIEGIKVEVDPLGVQEIIHGELDRTLDSGISIISTTTDKDGKYKFLWTEPDGPTDDSVDWHFHVSATDVDGAENGLFKDNLVPVYYNELSRSIRDDDVYYTRENVDLALSVDEDEAE